MAEIYPADFGDDEDKTKVISELFDSIQFYREKGKSLAAIHTAFCKSGLWAQGYSSFAKGYYQHRLEKEASDRGGRVKQSRKKSSVKNQKVMKPATDNSNESTTDVNSQLDSSAGLSPDMTLAEKRAFANRQFEKRRGEI